MMTKDRRLVAGNGKSVSVYEVLRHFKPFKVNAEYLHNYGKYFAYGTIFDYELIIDKYGNLIEPVYDLLYGDKFPWIELNSFNYNGNFLVSFLESVDDEVPDFKVAHYRIVKGGFGLELINVLASGKIIDDIDFYDEDCTDLRIYFNDRQTLDYDLTCNSFESSDETSKVKRKSLPLRTLKTNFMPDEIRILE